MITLEINNDNYTNDLMELIRLFEQRTADNFCLTVNYETVDAELIIKIDSDKLFGFKKTFCYPFAETVPMEIKRYEKRYLKMAIYNTLVFLTGISLPYGCLTGIRPTKLFQELKERAEKVFANDYSVSDEKLSLIKRIVSVQKGLRNQDENAMDIFVFIPFCPTKCAYCSFVSMTIDRQKKVVEPYVEKLVEELQFIHKLVKQKKIIIRSVYVGGGTPTSLPSHLLDKVLKSCKFKCKEFTVEAGRPDTITPEIVDVLRKNRVSRISINPQTFNDETLKKIGRKHTSYDVEQAYKMVKRYFDVNMDLIAMLPDETLEDFRRSVDACVALNPENITVHTLYLKKGSELKLASYKHTDYDTASNMVDYAYEKLTENGYNPYYMYRQKYTSGNLENVGYAKLGKECIYNIDIMEEDTSIIASGAAAISKKWTASKNLIERNANFKEPLEYVKHFDTVMSRQKEFWELQE